MANRVVASTCRECFVGCGSLIHLEDDKVIKITGNPAHPHSRGAFCAKGMNAPIASLNHPLRPLYPLRRTGERGEGKFERVSWDSALSEIADRLQKIKSGFGARAVAGAVSNQYYDRGVAMSLLLRSIGSPNYMINQDMCTGSRSTAAIMTGVHAEAGSELRNAKCILVVGRSPSESNIIEWMDIKLAKQNGTKLIVIDPRQTQLAKLADIWLQVQPGSDAALALAMVKVLFDEDLIDSEFVSRWCVGESELRTRVARYDVDYASGVTGIAAAKIVDAARMFALEGPSCLVLGHGIDAQANGVHTAMAFHAILALTGNIDREGSNRLHKTRAGFRDYVKIAKDPALRMPSERENEIIGGDAYPLWSGPSSWGSAAHNPSVIDAIRTGVPYPVKAIYISGVNIVCTYPGMQNTIDALKRLDLVVVATDHITPTAEFADFVLPKTTLLEEEGVFVEVGAPCLSIFNKAAESRGEVKTDVEIAIALCDKLRERGALDFECLPWRTHREFIDFQLKDTGMSFDSLDAGFHTYPYEYGSYELDGFKTQSKKIELCSSLLEQAGYDPVPDYKAPSYAQPTQDFDLILMTGIRVMGLHHSRFRNHAWARRGQKAPDIKMHPALGERLGLSNGEWVWVETPGGTSRVYLQAKLTEEMQPNVVATGMGWWFPELEGADHGALKFNVETAIPYGPDFDPISGSPESRNCPCRMGRADPDEVRGWPFNAIGKPSDKVA